MRTTVDLDEDVLLVARELARRRRVAIGKVLSDLARDGLTHREPATRRNGWPLFPVQPGATAVTLELVNRLRDESA